MFFTFTKERTPITTKTRVCKVKKSSAARFAASTTTTRERKWPARESFLLDLAACLAGPAGPVEAHRSTWIKFVRAFFDDDIVFQSFLCALRFWRWRFASLSLSVCVCVYIYIYIRARVVSLPLFLSLSFLPRARTNAMTRRLTSLFLLLLLLLLFNRDAKNRTNARRPGD